MFKEPNPYYSNFNLGNIVKAVASGGISLLKPQVGAAIVTGGLSNVTAKQTATRKIEEGISGKQIIPTPEPTTTPVTPVPGSADALAAAAAQTAAADTAAKNKQYIIYGVVGVILLVVIIYVLK
jgi:hypothetical protein